MVVGAVSIGGRVFKADTITSVRKQKSSEKDIRQKEDASDFDFLFVINGNSFL